MVGDDSALTSLSDAPSLPSTHETQALFDALREMAAMRQQESAADQAIERNYAAMTRWSLGLLAASALLLAAFGFRPLDWLLAAHALSFVLAIVLAVRANFWYAERHSSMAWFRDTKRVLLSNLREGVDEERMNIERLLAFDEATLTHARDRLKHELEKRQERSELLFGPVGKLGLFPTVLAAVVTLFATTRGYENLLVVAGLVALTGLLVWNHSVASNLYFAYSELRYALALLEWTLKFKQSQRS